MVSSATTALRRLALFICDRCAAPAARIELLDEVQMGSLNRYSRMGHPVENTLFIEFHGTDVGVKEQAEMVQGVAAEHGGRELKGDHGAPQPKADRA